MNLLSSLRSRIFLASALLAVLCIGVAISLVNVTVTLTSEIATAMHSTASSALARNIRLRNEDRILIAA